MLLRLQTGAAWFDVVMDQLATAGSNVWSFRRGGVAHDRRESPHECMSPFGMHLRVSAAVASHRPRDPLLLSVWEIELCCR